VNSTILGNTSLSRGCLFYFREKRK